MPTNETSGFWTPQVTCACIFTACVIIHTRALQTQEKQSLSTDREDGCKVLPLGKELLTTISCQKRKSHFSLIID